MERRQPYKFENIPNGPKPLVLIIEGVDPNFAKYTKNFLQGAEMQVLTASSSEEAFEIIRLQKPEIIIIGEPNTEDINQQELARKVGNLTKAPYILLAEKPNEKDAIYTLETGADDYQPRSTPTDEIAARIRAILRKSPEKKEKIVEAGNLRINLTQGIAWQNDEIARLSKIEWAILKELASNSGRVVQNRQLIRKVWKGDADRDLQDLRVGVARLRHKIEENPGRPKIVYTATGIGYLLRPSASRTH